MQGLVLSHTIFYKLIFLAFILCICFGAPLVMKQFTKGFHVSRFVLQNPVYLDQNVPESLLENEKLIQILSQPFQYLNRGAQSFVFESQDHQYVLKIFHENRSSTPFSKWKKQIKMRKKKKKNKRTLRMGFEGCLTAYREAREETALVYLHLCSTKTVLPKVKIYDPIGRMHCLSLDRYFFAIQKKAQSFDETLFQASLEGDLNSYFKSYFSLLDSRIRKGIWNEDTSLSSNFGFLNKQAIEIDFGHYVQRDQFLHPKFQAIEKKRFIQKLRDFIALHLPHELVQFDEAFIQFEENKK